MSAPETRLTQADELTLLREIALRAERLMATGDPLLQGQYLHLLGRVRALLTLKHDLSGTSEEG